MSEIRLEFLDLDQAEGAIAGLWVLLEANARLASPRIFCAAAPRPILSLSFEQRRDAEWAAARLEDLFPAVMGHAIRDPRSGNGG